MEDLWFSACCRVVCLIEGVGAVDEVRAVHVFQAPDRDEAFVRALEIGASHEQDYTNADGPPSAGGSHRF
jgi:hypothetical protein